MAKVSGWVVVVPKYNRYGVLQDAKLDRITQSRPQALSNGERAFRLTIDIPSTVFDPFAEVTVSVSDAAVIAPEVEIG